MAEDRAHLEAQQLSALRSLLARVAATNSFYRAKWQTPGLSGGIRDLKEFQERYPFTRKEELVADQAAHPPYGTNLTFPLDQYTRCHGTSGSTGRPLRWLDTPETWAWMLGHWRRVYEAAGVGRGDRVFFAFSFGPFLGFWTAFEAALSIGCLCLPGGGMTSVARLQSLVEQEATVLCCTPTYALHLAEVRRRHGMDPASFRIRRIIVAGEPGGSVPAIRESIESAWPGARVFDHHGMTEVGPVSYECPMEPRVLHVIESSYVAEIVDPATGAPVAPGTQGELVLTTLGRVGSPLIRYRTGDMVRARAPARCRCGTHDLALEGGILGRSDDMVVVRGVNVYPSAVDQVIRESPGVGEYRVRVQSTGSLLDLRIEVEPEDGSRDIAELVRDLEARFQTRLGLRVTIQALEPGSLPRFEMKARRWVRDPAGAR